MYRVGRRDDNITIGTFYLKILFTIFIAYVFGLCGNILKQRASYTFFLMNKTHIISNNWKHTHISTASSQYSNLKECTGFF